MLTYGVYKEFSPKGMSPCWQVEHCTECVLLLLKTLGYSCLIRKQQVQYLQQQGIPWKCCSRNI